ncbi:MAG: NUDIX hydrolase [Thermoleophilia bacterium]|nr:NUDIX hydrolase [Thermoleophilia bacterium]
MASAGPDSSETRFRGRLLALHVERWGEAEREVVERADSVAIVALDADDRVVLVRQRREPARRALLELPAGTVDPGEEPLGCAQRELAEETGLHGGDWAAGPIVYSTPGFCTERIHLFFAEGLAERERAPSDGEEVDLVRWPAHAVPSRLPELEDAKTLAGLALLVLRRS